MHPQTISEIVEELRATLIGRSVGVILQTGPLSLAIDFRSRDKQYLFLSVEPAHPRLYLITRPQRELEKQSLALTAFGQAVRSNLAGSHFISVEKDRHERVVRFRFRREQETGQLIERVLIAQLTGRSANLLLLDEHDIVLRSLRSLKGEGQQADSEYAPPPAQTDESHVETALAKGSFPSVSAAADAFYQHLDADQAFDAKVASVRSRLRQELTRLRKLQQHLQGDLADHGDPDEYKRLGDLLLANLATATRQGNLTTLSDFFAEGAPTIEIEIEEQSSLPEEAGRYFARYRKAKRARQQILARLTESEARMAAVARLQALLEEAAAGRDDAILATLTERQSVKQRTAPSQNKKMAEKIPGTRRYLSSDGYEILVGRAAKDNDHLTFRVARPYDLWLHAADYPGSHVVVQNPKRQVIPHRTLIEAAQLAAKFSHAGHDAKVNVHHTQRKYVSKIKGGAPGLVRLSSFKTITVQPAESIERI